jgi:AcrR family transcriptional regulator
MPRKRQQTLVRKPKQERAKATVAAILEAAAQILSNHGWEGFNTNIVARRAGVSIGSLYEYYSNKQELVDAVAWNHLCDAEALFRASRPHLERAKTEADVVALLVDGLVSLHQADPRLHKVLSSEVPLSSRVRDKASDLREEVIQLLSDAMSSRDDQLVRAQLLFDVSDAAVHRWYIDDGGLPLDRDRLSRQLKAMLTAYLAHS